MEQGWAEVLLAVLQDFSRRWATVRGWGVIEVGHFACENIIVVLNGVLGMSYLGLGEKAATIGTGISAR